MRQENFDGQWQTMSEELLTGMKEWRRQNPRATLAEIEKALDQRMARLRRQMLQDIAETSPAADWQEAPTVETPHCPVCQQPLQRRGEQERSLQTQGGELLVLKRQYGICGNCGASLFPPG